jgi:HTH-type transcriptional regulator, sugar sensing transcriptional regulator
MEVKEILKSFGLDEKETKVFWELSRTGWVTVLELSRKMEIKRSTLYRIIEQLVRKGLAEVKPDEHTSYYRSGTTETFAALIAEEKQKVSKMEDNLQQLQTQMKLLQTSGVQETGIHFYRGSRGIQVMELKMISQSNRKLRIFGTAQWHKTVGRKFAEEVRQKEVERGISVREICNPEVQEKIPASGAVSWTDNVEFIKRCFKHRQISRKELAINNEIMILPEALVLYSISDDEVVGIEIQSKSYANLMAGLFDGVWKRAEVIDKFG